MFKTGRKDSTGDFRRISIFRGTQMLQHIFYSSVVKLLDKTFLITDSQHRFRRKRSCELQLALFNHDVQSALKSHGEMDVATPNLFIFFLYHFVASSYRICFIPFLQQVFQFGFQDSHSQIWLLSVMA